MRFIRRHKRSPRWYPGEHFGRSPDLRVFAKPNLPEPITGSVVSVGLALRLQLRGQSRYWILILTAFPLTTGNPAEPKIPTVNSIHLDSPVFF